MTLDFGINQAEMILIDAGVAPVGKPALPTLASDYSAAVTSAKIYAGMVAARAARTRIGCEWSNIEPSKGTFYWTDMDRAVIMACQAGLKPLLTFIFPQPNWGPTASDFGVMCKAVAARYGMGSGGLGLIHDFEILNEMNSIGMFPNPNGAGYVPYLQAAFTNIKSVAPGSLSTVISGGIAADLSSFFTNDSRTMLNQMYAAGMAGYCDAVGYHPYSISPSTFAFLEPTATEQCIAWLNDFYNIMVANGDGGKQIWVTEFGFETLPTNPDGTGAEVNYATQAKWLVEQMQTLETFPFVGPCFQYNYRDSGNDANTNANDSYGLVQYDFTPKPSLAAVTTYMKPLQAAALTVNAALSVQVARAAAANFGAAAGLSAQPSPVQYRSAAFSVQSALDAPIYGRPPAPFTVDSELAVTAVESHVVAAAFAVAMALAAGSSKTPPPIPVNFATTVGLSIVAAQETELDYLFVGTAQGPFTPFGSGYTVGPNQFNTAEIEVLNGHPPTSDPQGTYYSGGIHTTPTRGPNHYAEVTAAPEVSNSSYGGDRSFMAIVRSDAAGNNWVGCTGRWGGADSTQILTCVNGVVTEQVNGTTPVTTGGDVVRLEADGNVYTMLLNGDEILSWTDYDGVFPQATNLHVGFGFQHLWTTLYWDAPPISGHFLGGDLYPVASTPTLAAAFGAAIGLTGSALESHRVAAALNAVAALSAPAYEAIFLPAQFAAGVALATAEQPSLTASAAFGVGAALGVAVNNETVTSFAASAALSVSAVAVEAASAAFAASVGLSVAAVQTVTDSVVLTASAAFSATALESHAVAMPLTAHDALAVSALQSQPLSPNFAAAAGLAANISSVSRPVTFGTAVGLSVVVQRQFSGSFASSLGPWNNANNFGSNVGGQITWNANAGAPGADPSLGPGLTAFGTYWLFVPFSDPLGTTESWAEVQTAGTGDNYPIVTGAFIGGSADGDSDCVFAAGQGYGSGTNEIVICSRVGGVVTIQASTGATTLAAFDKIRIVMHFDPVGGHWVYTALKNGVPIGSGLSWTDTAGILNPGRYWGLVYGASVYSGGSEISAPVGAWAASDVLAPPTPQFAAAAAFSATALQSQPVAPVFAAASVLGASALESHAAGAAIAASASFSAAAIESQQSAPAFGALTSMAAAVTGVTAQAGFGANAALSFTVSVGQPAVNGLFVVSAALAVTAKESQSVAPPFAVSAALAMAVKLAYAYTFSGTTKPAGMIDAGQTGTSVVSGGVLNEGTIPGTPTNNTNYRGVALYPNPVATSLYSAQVTVNSAATEYYEPCGVAIGFDSAGNTGLLLLMCALSNYEPTIQLVTKVGSTYTVVYSDTTNSTSGLTNPVLKVVVTYNGSHYVYTPYLNGTAITAAAWTDTGNVLGTPGKYWGAAFQPLYVSGAEYKSDGVLAMAAADT